MMQWIDLIQDQLGNELTGAQVYVTDATTGLAATIYSDNGTTAIPGSIVTTDITGQYTFYVKDGHYTLQISYLGTLFKTLTPVSIFDGVNDRLALTAAESAAGLLASNLNLKYPPGNVLRYGTNSVPGTTDMTAAISAAISVALGGQGFVYLPAGTYLVTSQLTSIAGQVTFYGDGRQESTILFNPAGAATCMKLANGAAQVIHVALRGFGIKSTEQTFTKVALDVYDLGTCVMDDIYIYGNGGSGAGAGATFTGGAGSIGLRTQGRDAVGVSNLQIVADYPIYIAANPNTAADIGEDIDHWNFRNCYLIANGQRIVTVADGLGIIDLTFDGYQAWVGGTSGFYMNDTRAAPSVPSRNISFKNIRTEQMTSAAQYAIEVNCTFPCQQLEVENTLIASGTKGIKVNAADHIVFKNVTTAVAAGIDALNVSGLNSRATMTMIGCYWGSATSLFVTTNYTAILTGAFSAANVCGPSDAVYVFTGQIPGTAFVVEKGTITSTNGVVALKITGTTGDGIQVIPQVAASGVSLRAINNGSTDFTPFGMTFSTLDLRYRTGAGTSATAAGIDTSGSLNLSHRLAEIQGAQVASANNLSLGTDGNYFQITGTTQINLLSSVGWQGGSVVTLKFNSTPTVKHNQTVSGNNRPILLAGAVDFVATANDTLTLRYDSTDTVWYEMSRAVI